jgi:hypothetical protein
MKNTNGRSGSNAAITIAIIAILWSVAAHPEEIGHGARVVWDALFH